MLKVVSELILRNGAAVFGIFVDVSESFAYCLPLCSNLLDNKLLYIGLFRHFLLHVVLCLLLFLLVYDVLIVLRVLDGVVSEEEALGLVDAVSDPRAEVLVIQLASSRLISLL